MSAGAARRFAWRLAPLGVGLLAATIAAAAARHSFSLAEVETVRNARLPWRELVPYWHASASGDLYLAALKPWLHAGSSEWVARVPSIAAFGLTATVLCLLGRRIFGHWVGLAAGIALATTAFSVDLGRTTGPLALAVLAVTFATWLFVIALETTGAAVWSAYAIVAAASVFLSASCAIALVAHVGATLIGQWSWRRAAVPAGVLALVATPVVVDTVATKRRLIEPLLQPSLSDVGRAVHEASGRNVILLALAVAGVVALALGRVDRSEPWKLTLVAAWAGLPLAGALVLSILRPSLDPRYLAVSAPALALLAAAGLCALPRRELVAGVALASLVVAGIRVTQSATTPAEDWRAATAYALSTKEPRDRAVIAPSRGITAFAFYAGPDRGSLTAAGPTAFVVVRARSDGDALKTARRAVRPPAYALREERRFGRHLWVQQWERTGLPTP